jgi:hypothetical protein
LNKWKQENVSLSGYFSKKFLFRELASLDGETTEVKFNKDAALAFCGLSEAYEEHDFPRITKVLGPLQKILFQQWLDYMKAEDLTLYVPQNMLISHFARKYKFHGCTGSNVLAATEIDYLGTFFGSRVLNPC